MKQLTSCNRFHHDSNKQSVPHFHLDLTTEKKMQLVTEKPQKKKPNVLGFDVPVELKTPKGTSLPLTVPNAI